MAYPDEASASVGVKVRQQWEVVFKIGYALHGTLTALLSSLENPPQFDELQDPNIQRSKFARMRLTSIRSQSETLRRQYVVLTDHVSQLCSFLDFQEPSPGPLFDHPYKLEHSHDKHNHHQDRREEVREPPLLDVEVSEQPRNNGHQPNQEEDSHSSPTPPPPKSPRGRSRRFEQYESSDLRKALLQHLVLRRLELEECEQEQQVLPESSWHPSAPKSKEASHSRSSRDDKPQGNRSLQGAASEGEFRTSVIEDEEKEVGEVVETLKMVVFDKPFDDEPCTTKTNNQKPTAEQASYNHKSPGALFTGFPASSTFLDKQEQGAVRGGGRREGSVHAEASQQVSQLTAEACFSGLLQALPNYDPPSSHNDLSPQPLGGSVHTQVQKGVQSGSVEQQPHSSQQDSHQRTSQVDVSEHEAENRLLSEHRSALERQGIQPEAQIPPHHGVRFPSKSSSADTLSSSTSVSASASQPQAVAGIRVQPLPPAATRDKDSFGAPSLSSVLSRTLGSKTEPNPPPATIKTATQTAPEASAPPAGESSSTVKSSQLGFSAFSKNDKAGFSAFSASASSGGFAAFSHHSAAGFAAFSSSSRPRDNRTNAKLSTAQEHNGNKNLVSPLFTAMRR